LRHGRHYSLLGALAWILCLLATVHCPAPPSTTPPAATEAASTSATPATAVASPPSAPAPTPIAASERAAAADSTAAPDADAVAERPAIVFLGTSLTAGYGLPEDEAYPALIQRRLDAAGLGYRVVNAGVSGDTSAGGLRRLDWLLRLPIAVLVVELGANDMLRGQSSEALEQNLAAILDRTRAAHPGVRFVVEGMRAAPNLGRDYATAFDAVYPRLAERFGAALVPFVLEDVVARPQLNQADGIHPTAEGHALIAERVWQTLEPVVRAAPMPASAP
jgi:acyl-CoA thioesterase-1